MKTIVNKTQKPAAVKESTALKKPVKKDAFDDDSFAKEASFQAWNSYKTDADRENFIRRQTYEKWCRDNERCPTEAIRPPTSYRPTQAPFKTQNPKNDPGSPCLETGSPHHPRCVYHPSELMLLLRNAPLDSSHSDIYLIIENLGIAVHDIRKIEANGNDGMPVWLLDFETMADWVNFCDAWETKGKGADLGLPREDDLAAAPEWHVQWRNPRLPVLKFLKDVNEDERESTVADEEGGLIQTRVRVDIMGD
jgi:hypothetical protein